MEDDPARFNLRNRPLTRGVVDAMLRQHYDEHRGILPSELEHFQRALVHRSYASPGAAKLNRLAPLGCMHVLARSNERDEWMGDAVIHMVVTSYLLERFEDQNEGFLTQMRTKIENGETLAGFARQLGLGPWLVLSKEVDDAGGRDAKAPLEDAFEAWMAAVYHTQGYDVARAWLVRFMETHVDFAATIVRKRDFKDMFCKYVHASQKGRAAFRELPAQDGPFPFRVSVADASGTSVVATGRGATLKDAENDAARAALRYYGRL